MIDDLKSKGSFADGKRGVLGRPKYKWRAVLVAMGVLAALGMLCLIFFPKLRKGVRELVDGQGKFPGTSAYLGMAVQDLNKSMAGAMGLESSSGVVVTSVVQSSPAERGGIEIGDVVLRFDGSEVDTVARLENLLVATTPGDTYSIVVDRRGQERTFYVELAQRPTYLMQASMDSQTELDRQWGCTLSPLTPDLIEQLSLPASIGGVAVVGVDPAGLARSAGMLTGDIIISVNRESTPDLASFYRAIEDERILVLGIYRSGEVVYLQVDAGSAASPLATIAGSIAENSAPPQRVAVAADGNSPSAQLALRFGTSPYFIVADLSTGRYTAVKNEVQADARGFGIAAAQLAAAQGVGATISVAYGPQAYEALKVMNIVPYTAEPGTVAEALQLYRSGRLNELTQPTLPGYGYARSIMATGGGPEDDEEEQDGYKGMPYSIPPKGKYDPALDPANALMAAAGSSQRSEYCYCPICQKLFPHPPSISCAELTCPDCGNRLRNWEPGSGTPLIGSGVPLAGSSPSSSGSSPFSGSPSINMAAPRSPSMGNAPSAGGSLFGSQPMGSAPMTGGSLFGGQPMGNAPMTGAPSTGGSLFGSLPFASLPSTRSTLTSPLPMQSQGQLRMGPASSGVGAGNTQGAVGSLYLNQQAQYCYCPICKTVHEHPPGVPCSSLVCPICGSRLISLNTAVGLFPVAAQTVAGMLVGGKPETIPPMGQLPTGTISTGTTAELQAAATALPSVGTQTPFQGTPQRPTYAGAAKGQRDLDPTLSTAGLMPAGVVVGGPATIPPMGQVAAGMLAGGKPETIPPMGQITAGMLAGGKPETIPPMGQTPAGTVVSGPTTIPPGGPRPSGTSALQASAATAMAGRPAAGTLGTSPPTGLLQGTVDGECVCPRCGTKVPHIRGTACYSILCPRCGTPMIRDGAAVGQLGIPMARTSAGDAAASSAVTISGDDSGSICIATSGPSMNDQIAPMFDRASYFMIVGLGTCKVVVNPNVDDQAGVGVQSAQLVVSEGAKGVITNDISVKALQELSRLRIRVYTGVTGTAQQGLEWYQNGRLTPSSLEEGNHDEHSGASKGKGSTSSSKKL